MHKLNRKGYLTVEIVLASVVAFLIAFFLFDITMKLVDVTNDTYFDTEFITDKALIIKNIKSEIEKDIQENGKITSVECINSNTFCKIYYNNTSQYNLVYSNTSRTLKYYSIKNISLFLYSKQFDNNINDLKINMSLNGDYLFIKIAPEDIFSDKDNDINIIVYNG